MFIKSNLVTENLNLQLLERNISKSDSNNQNVKTFHLCLFLISMTPPGSFDYLYKNNCTWTLMLSPIKIALKQHLQGERATSQIFTVLLLTLIYFYSFLGVMPAYIEHDGLLCTKLVCFYKREDGSTLPSTQATVVLLDPEYGNVKAVSCTHIIPVWMEFQTSQTCFHDPTRRSWVERSSRAWGQLQPLQSPLRYNMLFHF